MKKHYEKMCMTPLGVVFEGNLLQCSVVTNDSVVTTTGQEVQSYDFTDNTSDFNHTWE